MVRALKTLEPYGASSRRYRAYIRYAEEAIKNMNRLITWVSEEPKELELLAWPARNLFEIFLMVSFLDDKPENFQEFTKWSVNAWHKVQTELIKAWSDHSTMPGILQHYLDDFEAEAKVTGIRSSKPKSQQPGKWRRGRTQQRWKLMKLLASFAPGTCIDPRWQSSNRTNVSCMPTGLS